MATFGSDFAGVDDLDANLTFLEGIAPDGTDNEAIAFMQAIARRFKTSRGGMFYDPNYGTNMADFIADSIPATLAEKMIAAEARKDERTVDAECSITVSDNGAKWEVRIHVWGNGTLEFVLTLSVDKVSVELLKAEIL